MNWFIKELLKTKTFEELYEEYKDFTEYTKEQYLGEKNIPLDKLIMISFINYYKKKITIKEPDFLLRYQKEAIIIQSG